jgi:hydroxyacylglutathione hydrolase
VYFKQFLHDDLGCSSYFIASRQSREAVIVDPQFETKAYVDLAHERGYTIVAVIDTHLHADHISGNRALAAATGATLYLHEAADVLFPFHKLRDGDEVTIGQVILRVVHTPGHRPEMISLLVINPPRSPEASMVLSGDCLFVGDVGRPDFGGPEGAIEEYESIQRLLGFADWVEVFPAHFEGSCGRGMCGRPSSTIGFERRYNPVLQLNREDFLRLESQATARPLNMTAILDTNRGAVDYAWAQLRHADDVPAIKADEAPAWLGARDAFVLDVREPEEHVAGHLPGAISVPQADLATRLGEVPKDRDVLVVCAGGTRSARCTAFLHQMGFARAISLDGGTDGWRDAGHRVVVGR